MKKMTLLKNAAIVMILALTAVSCGSDDSGPSDPNLVELANANGLTTFTAAVERAGYTDMLSGSQKYTVFGPTNSAMEQFLLSNGYINVDAVPVDLLKEIVLNHILAGDLSTQAMETSYKNTFAHGDASSSNTLSIFINAEQAPIMLNGYSAITGPNLDASNGRLHIVDKVIPMPTVLTLLQAHPILSTFSAGLAFNPASQWNATLSGDGPQSPFTVFAPTNDAFVAFFDELEYEEFADFPVADLEEILAYQIQGESNTLFSQLTDGLSVTTLAEQNFTISNTGGGKKITDTNARVSNFTTIRDIQATNGVIHVIDKTLLPDL